MLRPLGQVAGNDSQIGWSLVDEIFKTLHNLCAHAAKVEIGDMNQDSHSVIVKRIAVILNQGSQRGPEVVNSIRKHCEDKQIQIVDVLYPQLGDYTRTIVQIATQVDAFAVGGGDGTLNLAIEGLLQARKPMIVLPLGTANNLARNLSIPTDLEKACNISGGVRGEDVDVATVNGIYFLNVVGLGLSTKVNRHADPKIKQKFGVIAYMFYAVKILMSMKALRITIKTEFKEYQLKALQVSVCNGRFYGSGMVASETASIQDQILDLIATQAHKWWRAPFLIAALIKGTHRTKDEILSLRDKSFEIQTSKPHSLDVDGDVRTKTPAIFKMHPEKLKVLIPNP